MSTPSTPGASAILYGAKSTQDRRRSLKTQLEDAREFAEDNDWTVVAEYKDEGFSAYSGNRGPDLRLAEQHAARVAAETGQPCMIVAQAADRFARGAGDAPGASEHLVEVWARWRRQDVWMRTVEDDEYMHSAERVAARGELANMESKRKSRSVTKGMKRRRTGDAADDGLPRHTGGAVFGYRRDEAKGLVPDPITGPTVVRIFSMAAAHQSVVGIATTLQAEYEATGAPKPLRSTAWRQGSISHLLKSRTALGEIPGDDPAKRARKHAPEVWIKAAHDPLPGMSEDLWRAAQDAVAQRAKKPGAGGGRRSKAGHLLVKGALRHAVCGEAMTPISNTNAKGEVTSAVYICSGAKEGRCDRPAFRIGMRDVDDAVTEYLAAVGIDAEATLAALQKAAAREGEGTDAELEAARSEGARLEAQHARMWGLFKDGDLDATDWSRFKTENADERAANAAAVERLETQAQTIARGPEAVVPMAADALALVRASVAAGDVDAVRGALGTLFDCFLIGEVDDMPQDAVPGTPQERLAARSRLHEQVAALEVASGRTVTDAEAQAGAEDEALRQLIGDPTDLEPDPLDVGLTPSEGVVVLPMPREDALRAIVRDGRPVQMVDDDGRLVFRRLPLEFASSGLTGEATTNKDGFDKKSSAPASKARTRSTSPQRPLNTNNGRSGSRRLPAVSAARTRRTTSRPEPSARPTSRIARSGNLVSNKRTASLVVSASTSSQPSALSSSARNVRVGASSSATRMVAGVSSVMPP
jgi:DNA invertase Pin-like site-specific DNA recombinase